MGMKRWLLRIAVVFCALVVLMAGGWWVCRTYYSGPQLLEAVEDNDIERVKYRAVARYDLHAACAAGDIDGVQELLAQGADPNKLSHDGTTPVWIAVVLKHGEILRMLIAAGGDAIWRTGKGYTYMHLAAQAMNTDAIRLLLAHGADPNATDSGLHTTPLHLAASVARDSNFYTSETTDCIRALLDGGADPHRTLSDGRTALDIWPELAEIIKEIETEKAGKKQPAQPKVATP